MVISYLFYFFKIFFRNYIQFYYSSSEFSLNFLLSVYNVILKKFYLNVKLKISLIMIPKINYCSCIKDDNNYDLDYNTFDS